MSTDQWINVKVRFKDQRSWWFIAGSNGTVTRLCLHAVAFNELDKAHEIAQFVIDPRDEASPGSVVASRVIVDGKEVARYGEVTTPPRAVYGAMGGFRYLIGARNGRGIFHVVEDGRWANVDCDVYNGCHDEAKRAGLDPSHLTIHGYTATISTHGLRFVQEMTREAVTS